MMMVVRKRVSSPKLDNMSGYPAWKLRPSFAG
jgi:hypothetical protein